MGLHAPLVEFIVAEHTRRAITGDVGFIGKQTTGATEKSLRYLQHKYKLTAPKDFQFEFDLETQNVSSFISHPFRKLFSRPLPQNQITHFLKKQLLKNRDPLRYISDTCFMKFLGVKSFSAVDVSDYEGADIICDLSIPIPKNLYNKFDFIFNGSCLDNIFNPAEAIKNLSRMLRADGRLVMVEHGSMMNSPYTAFSPGWFFDFFCYNQYSDCRVYHTVLKGTLQQFWHGPWPLYLFNWQENKNCIPPKLGKDEHLLYLVIAEKGNNSTDDQLPIQKQYRDSVFDKTVFQPQALQMWESAKSKIDEKICSTRDAFLKCGFLGKNIPL